MQDSLLTVWSTLVHLIYILYFLGQNYLTLALLTYLSLIKQKQFLISGAELAYHSNNICAFCSHILSLYWHCFQYAPGSHQRSWPVLEPGVPIGPLGLNPQPCGRPHIQVSTELLQEDITVGAQLVYSHRGLAHLPVSSSTGLVEGDEPIVLFLAAQLQDWGERGKPRFCFARGPGRPISSFLSP